tara:strand:+ start:5800 stop:6726 length:927 start_codon:yes stop_codon:yes gene_type:complete
MNDSYGNKRSLDDWTQSTYDFDYLSIPGLAKECFLDEDYTIWHDQHDVSYFWGNHLLNKGANIKSFGVAPFVYGEYLETTELEQKYSTIFLPRSDFSTKLKSDSKKIVYENLQSIDLENPLFVSYPVDYKFWEEIIPRENLYCIGRDIFSVEWTKRLVRLYKKSKKVYFPHFCSGVLYCSYVKNSINFYDEGKIYDKVNEYTYSPEHKSDEWNYSMNHLKDIFSDDIMNEEKKYITYNMLSLDRIQTPLELYKCLYLLVHKKEASKIDDKVLDLLDVNHLNTKLLKNKCDSFLFDRVSAKTLKLYSRL